MYCPLLFAVEGLGPKGGGRVAPLDWDEGDREARTCVIKDGTGVYNINVTIMLQCYNYCFITEAHEGMRTHTTHWRPGKAYTLDTGYWIHILETGTGKRAYTRLLDIGL